MGFNSGFKGLILKFFIILLLDNNWNHKKFPNLIYTKFLPT